MGMSAFFADLLGFFSVYADKFPSWAFSMGRAMIVTLEITGGAFALGLLIGLVVAIARLSRNRAVSRAAFAYVEIARGVPALVILFLIYFGMVPLGLVLEAVPAAIIGLGLSAGGYIAEIFRAGIEATHRGQREAGLTIGMSPLMIYRYIIVPQATRVALPPLLNTLISVLKDSSLASLISAPEIMLRAKDISSSEFLPLHIFVWAGVMYFLLALPLSWAARIMERRMGAGLARACSGGACGGSSAQDRSLTGSPSPPSHSAMLAAAAGGAEAPVAGLPGAAQDKLLHRRRRGLPDVEPALHARLGRRLHPGPGALDARLFKDEQDLAQSASPPPRPSFQSYESRRG
jgi:His/Glu/Gln/Arg/opine family amino acid ABC transporter permease subunit